MRTTAAGNQILVGYLAAGPGRDIDLAAARELLGASLPAPLIPLLTARRRLPTKTSGKVDRHALPWPLAGAGAADADAAPLNLPDDAQWIVEQWGAVLGSAGGEPRRRLLRLRRRLAGRRPARLRPARPLPHHHGGRHLRHPRVGRPDRRGTPVAAGRRRRARPGATVRPTARKSQVVPDAHGRSRCTSSSACAG